MKTTHYPSFVEWTLAELSAKPLPVAALDFVLKNSIHAPQGFQLEFGAHSGTTINRIARSDFSRLVWGFDSFQGLPEAWRPGYPAGKFDMAGRLPNVLPNVVLIPGWFHESIPRFRERFLRASPISLLHVDCDLYSSTITVLRELHDNIRPGTVVVFDELVNYPGFEEHELRALFEYCRDFGWGVEYLGCPGPPDHWKRTKVDKALYQQVVARFL